MIKGIKKNIFPLYIANWWLKIMYHIIHRFFHLYNSKKLFFSLKCLLKNISLPQDHLMENFNESTLDSKISIQNML